MTTLAGKGTIKSNIAVRKDLLAADLRAREIMVRRGEIPPPNPEMPRKAGGGKIQMMKEILSACRLTGRMTTLPMPHLCSAAIPRLTAILGLAREFGIVTPARVDACGKPT